MYTKFPDIKETDNIFYVCPKKINLNASPLNNTIRGWSDLIKENLGFNNWEPRDGDYELWCIALLITQGFVKHGMMHENVNDNLSDGQEKGNEDQHTKKLDIEAENANATVDNILDALDMDKQICCIALQDSKNGMLRIHLNVKLNCNPSAPGAKKPFIKYTVSEDRFLHGKYALIDFKNPPTEISGS